MRDSVDYKKKYLDIRAKMVTSMDMAFRMGYEKGGSDAAQQQMQMQQQQLQQQQAQMAQMQGQGQDPSQQGMDPGQDPSQDPSQQGAQDLSQNPNGMPGAPQQEELDQYIGELESLVSKGEISAEDLKKSITKIKNFQSNTRLNKSLNALKSNKQFKLNPNASVNMTSNDKQNLSMQEKIVSEIMKKWENEAPKTTSQAMQALGVEVLTKGE